MNKQQSDATRATVADVGCAYVWACVCCQLLSSAVRVASSAVLSARTVSSPSVWRVSAAAFHSGAPLRAAAPAQSAAPGSVIDFNLADIGEGIAECEVLRWFIKEGDTIAQFDKVCEVRKRSGRGRHAHARLDSVWRPWICLVLPVLTVCFSSVC